MKTILIVQTKTLVFKINYKKKGDVKRLENYERVDDIDDVPINTHVRYVTLDKDKKQLFRLGGLLKIVDPRYVMLSNGRHTWSVQRYHFADDASTQEPIFETIFWKCITKELKLQSKIGELQDVIESLEEQLKDTIYENNKLKILSEVI